MSLRTRIALSAALAVIVAFAVGGLATFEFARRSLYAEVDASLRETALREAERGLRGGELGGRGPDRIGGPEAAIALIDADGRTVLSSSGGEDMPAARVARRIAAEGGVAFADLRADGEPLRALVVGVRPGLALQVGRSTREIEESLDRLRGALLVAGGLGAVLAVLLGLLVANRGLVPLRRLAEEVDAAAHDGDITRRLTEQGGAESERLARSVNDLLAGIEEARTSQDQLVADAAHELRTPLTALRTNVELLADPGGPRTAEERLQTAAAIDREIAELAVMVTGMVDLARGARPVERREALRLDDLAADVVARTRARHPAAAIELVAEPTPLQGDPARLERALANLLENALIHGAPPVQVHVRPGAITVDDAGPGVPDADREAMFDRFRRGSDAQNRPGSGLGLAIARQDIGAHGGTIAIGTSPAGGCRVIVTLPGSA